MQRSIHGALDEGSRRLRSTSRLEMACNACRKALACVFISVVMARASVASHWSRAHLAAARAVGGFDWALSVPSRALGEALRRGAKEGLHAARASQLAPPDTTQKGQPPFSSKPKLVSAHPRSHPRTRGARLAAHRSDRTD